LRVNEPDLEPGDGEGRGGNHVIGRGSGLVSGESARDFVVML